MCSSLLPCALEHWDISWLSVAGERVKPPQQVPCACHCSILYAEVPSCILLETELLEKGSVSLSCRGGGKQQSLGFSRYKVGKVYSHLGDEETESQ